MEFKEYQHIERFGNTEVEGIEYGACYIFPKIDGTNSQLYIKDGFLMAGSRKRELTLTEDNAGFYRWACEQENFKAFFIARPDLRLYGEWLVPHTLKDYRPEAWRQFYVFDVEGPEGLGGYEDYSNILSAYNINFIQPIAIIQNPTYDNLIAKLEANTYLMQDGKGAGEGIVIKNYGYKNKYGNQIWAKIVRAEFKEKHVKEMGLKATAGSKQVESEIITKYLTQPIVEKVYSNIVSQESGWTSRFIPRLLQTVFYDLIKEESWNFIKENKMPTINYKTLSGLCNQKIKELKPELFR
jgi:hypothetical protein